MLLPVTHVGEPGTGGVALLAEPQRTEFVDGRDCVRSEACARFRLPAQGFCVERRGTLRSFVSVARASGFLETVALMGSGRDRSGCSCLDRRSKGLVSEPIVDFLHEKERTALGAHVAEVRAKCLVKGPRAAPGEGGRLGPGE